MMLAVQLQNLKFHPPQPCILFQSSKLCFQPQKSHKQRQKQCSFLLSKKATILTLQYISPLCQTILKSLSTLISFLLGERVFGFSLCWPKGAGFEVVVFIFRFGIGKGNNKDLCNKTPPFPWARLSLMRRARPFKTNPMRRALLQPAS